MAAVCGSSVRRGQRRSVRHARGQAHAGAVRHGGRRGTRRTRARVHGWRDTARPGGVVRARRGRAGARARWATAGASAPGGCVLGSRGEEEGGGKERGKEKEKGRKEKRKRKEKKWEGKRKGREREKRGREKARVGAGRGGDRGRSATRARGFVRGTRSAGANCGSGRGRSATHAVFARGEKEKEGNRVCVNHGERWRVGERSG
ncbi:hypothetical protein GQ55_1G337300 [Panicum hallii var. hallii]|uniref:Uncharacterized protein n=1 Tax=Panicum hallii var. hallii TaxID=1504633 RepID=A0A2T7FAB7_9POAL|nr:hypothetical protein GQ55_1G337300 [Panicum hallii var. hallii]